jgi:HSP20 family protein
MIGKEVKSMAIRDFLPSTWRRDFSPVRRDEDYPYHALQQEMNRIFDDFFRGFDVAPFGMERFGAFSPSVDVKEDEKEMLIKAELPGLDEKDVEVTLTDGTLTIKGEKKEEKEDRGKHYYRMERSYGAFNRVVALPEGLDTDRANASFKNGVLNISLPKTEEATKNVKKITINKG